MHQLLHFTRGQVAPQNGSKFYSVKPLPPAAPSAERRGAAERAAAGAVRDAVTLRCLQIGV